MRFVVRFCKQESENVFIKIRRFRFFNFLFHRPSNFSRCPKCGRKVNKPFVFNKRNGKICDILCNGATVPRDLYKDLFERINQI